MKTLCSKLKIKEKGTIAIKYKNRSKKNDSQKIIKIFAEILTKNKTVNLSNPDIEIRCILTDNYVYLYKKLFKIDRSQFEKRKAQFRPFFSPISLFKLYNSIFSVSKNSTNFQFPFLIAEPGVHVLP